MNIKTRTIFNDVVLALTVVYINKQQILVGQDSCFKFLRTNEFCESNNAIVLC